MAASGEGPMNHPENILEPDGDVVIILGKTANGPLGKISFQVSSKHMKQVSPVFRAMLSGTFKPGVKLGSKGCLRVPLPEDEPEAFGMLLRVSYGQTGWIPKKLDIDILVDMAMLIDKYQFNNVMSYFSASWFSRYKSSLLFTPDIEELMGFNPAYETVLDSSMTDLYQWLFVAYYFGLKKEFARAAGLLVRQSCERISDNEAADLLPIPVETLDKLEDFRLDILSSMTIKLQTIMLECQPQNFSEHLSKASRNVLRAIGGEESDPDRPFCGISFHQIVGFLNEVHAVRCNQPKLLENPETNMQAGELPKRMKLALSMTQHEILHLKIDDFMLGDEDGK